MQIFPISDHVVVEIEKDSVATFIPMKKEPVIQENQELVIQENQELVIQEIEELIIRQQRARITVNCNCRHLENKLSICFWMLLIIGIVAVVLFFIAWGRFNGSSQHYPPPPN
jgi:hypothetical protein